MDGTTALLAQRTPNCAVEMSGISETIELQSIFDQLTSHCSTSGGTACDGTLLIRWVEYCKHLRTYASLVALNFF